ncbi:MAG: hypothetical protein GEU98_09040 [Pseudonocardiaceae bacterium]|nr:hypothetical protein [Pseudonocardiaceae bacterium]
MGHSVFSEEFCLDFASTLEWRHTRRVDAFRSAADLAPWFYSNGVRLQLEPLGEAALANAHELRDAIHHLGLNSVHGKHFDVDDVATVNRCALPAPLAITLDSGGTMRYSGDFPALLSSIARAAIELLAGPHRELIRQCAEPECTRLFLDHSRAGARRWCGTACGNKVKAAAYRERKRSKKPSRAN